MLEEAELPDGLCVEDGARAAAEATVVDSCDAALVVGEFFADLSLGNGVRELGFLGGAVSEDGVFVFHGGNGGGFGKCCHCLGRVSGWR